MLQKTFLASPARVLQVQNAAKNFAGVAGARFAAAKCCKKLFWRRRRAFCRCKMLQKTSLASPARVLQLQNAAKNCSGVAGARFAGAKCCKKLFWRRRRAFCSCKMLQKTVLASPARVLQVQNAAKNFSGVA